MYIEGEIHHEFEVWDHSNMEYEGLDTYHKKKKKGKSFLSPQREVARVRECWGGSTTSSELQIT